MKPITLCPMCASPLPADDPQGHCPHCLKPGGRFNHGRYTLYEPLAIDRIGVLWRACDEHLDGFVALRFLAHDLRADRAAMEGIRLEVERARRLIHPNIARVHELHEGADEPAYVVSEWVKGESLTSRLQQQPQACFTWPEGEPWLLQLGQALDHAHREGVLHGNLTADDVRLDHEGRIKITGFGFACLSGVVAPGSEPVAGWSPQQHAGLFAEAADDIYALGALGYELLSGRPPFYLGDIASQARHVLPKPLEERLADFGLDDSVPPPVAAAIMSCLAKERADRPSSVAAVLTDMVFAQPSSEPEPPAPVLEEVAAPVSPPPAPAATVAIKIRWGAVAGWTGVAAGLLVLGLVAYWYRGFDSASQAAIAVALLAAGESRPAGKEPAATNHTQQAANSSPARPALEPATNANPELNGHEIVGYYGAANNGGTVLRIADKAPVSQGDRIRVTGMGVYDGEWTVLQAFPYQGPNDARPLWGYRIEAPRQLVPGFTGQGGPSLNRARLFPVTRAGGASAMSATNSPSASTKPALAPAGPGGPGNILPASKYETLWNEKSDFSHWRGEAQFWSIENGILTGRMTSVGRTWLTWAGSPVDDFELVLVFRTKGDGQAAVRYRARTDEAPTKYGELTRYSAILNERTIPSSPLVGPSKMFTEYVGNLVTVALKGSGFVARHYGPQNNAESNSLRNTLRLNGRSELIPPEMLDTDMPAPANGGEWTELIINAQARRLAHWRNRRLVTAVLDADFSTAEGPSIHPDPAGGIQLELHNYLPGRATPPGMTIEVQFKEIRLTRLPKVPPIRITNALARTAAPGILPRPAGPPPRPIRLESEQWPILEQQDCKAGQQTMTAYGAQLWSGGKQLFCGSGARGLIAFNLPVERAGRYRLELLTTVAPDFGTFQVSVNGQPLGPAVDGYGRNVSPAKKISLGPIQLAAGNNRLQFQVTGKNPLSTGYYMGLDCVDLIPAAT